MKYIFKVNAQNQRIKNTISERTNIIVKVNLHSSKSSNSEMWVIYDDKTNQISYFNSISKDRNHAYRAIFISNDNTHDVFISLLARIRKFVSLKIDKTNIIGYTKFLNSDLFDSLFIDNSFENPLIIGMPAFISKEDYSSLIIGNVNKEYNLGILSIELADNDPYCITGYKYKPYNIPDNESLLGCKIIDFVKGINSLDIKSNLSDWFKDASFSDVVGSLMEGEVEIKEYTGLEWGLHFIIIRNGLKTVTIKLDDFLSSIDVNDRIMWNIISNMADLTEGETINESFRHNSDNVDFYSCISDDGDLVCLSNILDMKHHKFNLCNGQSI